MFLVVGLGNPGAKYENTRHNIGFKVVDELARRWGTGFLSKFHSLFGEHTIGTEKCLILKPTTFMNRTGIAVGEIASFYKIPPRQCLVVSDEIDLAPGTLRLRLSGSSGGHNGLKSVIEGLGTQDFPRLRIGVGRSPTLPSDEHVLSQIPKRESAFYEGVIREGADAVEMILREGIPKAMNSVNRKKDQDVT